MLEKWAAVTLLVERMTRYNNNDELVIPVITPLTVPTLFRFPEARQDPLDLTWSETRALTLSMKDAVNGAWPDKASRNFWLVGVLPHADAMPETGRPPWMVTCELGDRFPPVAGSA